MKKRTKAALIGLAVLTGAGALIVWQAPYSLRARIHYGSYSGARLTGGVTVTLDGKPCACTVTAGDGTEHSEDGVRGLNVTEQNGTQHIEIDTGGKNDPNWHIFTVQPEESSLPPVTVEVSFTWWKVAEFDLHIDADSASGEITAGGECRMLRDDGGWENRMNTVSEQPYRLVFRDI